MVRWEREEYCRGLHLVIASNGEKMTGEREGERERGREGAAPQKDVVGDGRMKE